MKCGLHRIGKSYEEPESKRKVSWESWRILQSHRKLVQEFYQRVTEMHSIQTWQKLNKSFLQNCKIFQWDLVELWRQAGTVQKSFASRHAFTWINWGMVVSWLTCDSKLQCSVLDQNNSLLASSNHSARRTITEWLEQLLAAHEYLVWIHSFTLCFKSPRV